MVTDIEPTGLLKKVSFRQVQYISEAVTTIYTSFIGHSLLGNVEDIQAREHHTYITATDVSTGAAKSTGVIHRQLSFYLWRRPSNARWRHCRCNQNLVLSVHPIWRREVEQERRHDAWFSAQR